MLCIGNVLSSYIGQSRKFHIPTAAVSTAAFVYLVHDYAISFVDAMDYFSAVESIEKYLHSSGQKDAKDKALFDFNKVRVMSKDHPNLCMIGIFATGFFAIISTIGIADKYL